MEIHSEDQQPGPQDIRARGDGIAYQPGPHGSEDDAFNDLFYPKTKPQNAEQAEFLVNVRATIQSLNPGYAPLEFLDALREHLSPAALFHPVLIFRVFHKKLRNYMVEKAKVALA